MDLNRVDISGFGRFEKRTSMRFEGKVTAIVGPNEAGKTSFLRALEHWSSALEFTLKGRSPDLSRGIKFEDSDEIISCSFNITQKDIDELLHQIPEAIGTKTFIETKLANGKFRRKILPKIVRNNKYREELSASIEKSLKRESIEFLKRYENSRTNIEDGASLEQVVEVLVSERETLNLEDFEILNSAKEVVDGIESKNADPQYLQVLADKFHFLIEHEGKQHPEEQAIAILRRKCPAFLLFTEKNRILKSSYVHASIDEDLDASIINLAKLANLSLSDLTQAVVEEDTTESKELLDSANRILAEEFKTWSQSEVSIELALDIKDQNTLTLMITNPPGGRKRLRSLEEGSEGLKQFVSLFAFLKANANEDAENILLIDEVETHLHYDAQADLIQMLTEQLLSKKVIYTTHSLGCLPEDLGNGIRFIERNKKDNTSNIQNWFWAKDKNSPGFSSILFGMGATSMTFIPMSFTVFAEGAVDHLLLPTLMREAVGKDFLGFHVAPGISNASVDQMRLIDREAVKTVYITDADHGRDSLHKQLIDANIPEASISSIFDIKSGVTIEDIINPVTYANVINAQIKIHNEGVEIDMKVNEIPETQRSKAVENWCKRNGIANIPEKRNVAFGLLKMKTCGDILLDDKYKSNLIELYSWADSILHPSP